MHLNASQAAFLALHATRQVTAWTWQFGDSMLRAQAGKRFATIRRDELNGLIEVGFMFKGAGIADVHATDAGRVAVKEMAK